MLGRKGVLTTGQVAAICRVAPRTVSKWFDGGQLKGYRVPGSRDRRIPVEDLIRFMRAHGMPLQTLESGATRILVVDTDRDRAESLVSSLNRDETCEAEAAPSAFSAGIVGARFVPHVILVNTSAPDLRRAELCAAVRCQEELGGVKVVALTSDAESADRLRGAGYDACLIGPFDSHEVMKVVDSLLASV